MDIDEPTLKTLSEIQNVLQKSYTEIERLEFLSYFIFRGRGLIVLSLIVIIISAQWWFILLVIPFGYFQMTQEVELKDLKSKESSNRERIKEKTDKLRSEFNLKFNSEHSFIYSHNSEKRLHIDTGNWVPYYE